MSKLGVVGLGHMGFAILTRLRDQGFDVAGYDTRAAVSECETLVELAHNSEVVLLSLPNGAAVEDVVGEIAGSGGPKLVVDTSTSGVDACAQAAETLRQAGIDFLDAPVSGGKLGAESGTLTMLVGGHRAVLAQIEPTLRCLAKKMLHVGPVGSAQATKLMHNVLVAVQLIAVSEAVRVAAASGVDENVFIHALNLGSGRSAVSEINFPQWILNDRFDSGFTMKLMRKDVREALAAALRLGVDLPLMQRAGALWADSVELIRDDADFNRIVELACEGPP